MEIKVFKDIMSANQKLAQTNRAYFKDKSIAAVNVMASPGAGKTSIILEIIKALKESMNFGVIEGDIASSIDAEKVGRLGIPVVQINTGGGCHLDANMIKLVVEDLELKENSILFIENVGNLVCPSSFDLGENIRMVIASVPEGHDKPYKYLSMFETADVIILNKSDLLPYIDFDMDYFMKGIRALNEKAPVFQVSCKTGGGLGELFEYCKGILRRSSFDLNEN